MPERPKPTIIDNVMPRYSLTREERVAARAEAVRIRGREIIRQQFSELIHEANAILRQRDRYEPETVATQESIRDRVYGFGTSVGLTTSEIDHISEDEYARREEERRRDERDGEYST